MDAYEERWRRVLWFSVVALILDVVFVLTTSPAGTTKLVCLLLVIATIGTCLVALIKLHRTSGVSHAAISDLDLDDLPLPDASDVLSAFDHDD